MSVFLAKSFKWPVWLILVSAISVGCGKANVQVYHDVEANRDYPRTVAILPFSYDSGISEGKRPHIILRGVFFNYFSYLGYTDLPLEKVDLKIGSATKNQGDLSDFTNSDLRKILGTDAIIRGHVVNATNFTAGIYAETSIKAKLEMIDLRTGQLLWETEHNELSSSSIVTPSIIDMVKDQTANSEIKEAYHKVAESFSLKILDKVPDPSRIRHGEVALPRIVSVEANIQGNSKLQSNDLIYVSMAGDPGLNASFGIGSFRTGVLMKEVSPGLYTGSYRIKKGDRIGNALIITSLTNKEGLTAKKFYKKAMAIVRDESSRKVK